jgi:glucan phosphoethanolaminetransferase (alkaline phosphatase superfamily)
MRHMRSRDVYCLLGMFLILVIPCIIYTAQHFDGNALIYHLLFKTSLMLFLICVPLLFLKPAYVFGVFAIPLVVSIPFESINLILLNGYIQLDGIAAIFKTNLQEALWFSSVLIPYYIGVFVCIVLYFVLFFLSRSAQISRREKRRISYVCAFSLLVSAVIFTNYTNYKPRLRYVGTRAHNIILREYVLKEYPFNFWYRLREYRVLTNRLAKYKAERDSFLFGCSRPPRAEDEVYVFVIGEGMRYANWHINGYNRETSPMLDHQHGLVSFRNLFSTGNSTILAIPMLISRATPKDYEKAFREKTIVSLFKEAGFTTYWISNQNIFNYVYHASEVDHLHDLVPRDENDLIVLPQLEDVLSDTMHSKKFVVINLRGYHIPYSVFPEQFNHFKPNAKDVSRTLSFENKEYFVNQYDNLMLLEDYVLGNVIRKLEEKSLSSFMLFAPDHAVNLFDEAGLLFGYGSAEMPDSEIHIPMFIWCSEKFRRENSEKYRLLQQRAEDLCSTTNVFYTLGDLADIQGNYLNPRLSLCNEQFSVDSIRTAYTGEGERVLRKY